MFSTLMKQWDEGVYHHLLRPMKSVDLTKEARIDGLSVREYDCDFNYDEDDNRLVPLLTTLTTTSAATATTTNTRRTNTNTIASPSITQSPGLSTQH